jgi:hypothetical protein
MNNIFSFRFSTFVTLNIISLLLSINKTESVITGIDNKKAN